MPEKKLQKIKEYLYSTFLERCEQIDGVLTALISRQHILLIGAPGTAKSMIARAICSCIDGAKYFERILTKYSVPDELFGPVKLSALKNDKFERDIDNHLPTADIAFIDEVFKANSSILNSLLTLMNERLFYNNGKPTQCPLITMIGASNELPSEDENLTALYDRFLLRYTVEYIKEDSSFIRLLTSDEITEKVQPPVTITFDELKELQEKASKVQISSKHVEIIANIRKSLNNEGIIVSDRRYKQSISVLKAYAFLHGHEQVSGDDFEILTWCYWQEPNHIHKVRSIIVSLTNPYAREADEIYDACQGAIRELDKATDKDKTALATETLAKIKQAKTKLIDIRQKMSNEGRDTTKINDYINKIDGEIRRLLNEYLGIST
ncbi:MAG: AAA family ATPase [Thermoplasmata archaeon]